MKARYFIIWALFSLSKRFPSTLLPLSVSLTAPQACQHSLTLSLRTYCLLFLQCFPQIYPWFAHHFLQVSLSHVTLGGVLHSSFYSKTMPTFSPTAPSLPRFSFILNSFLFHTSNLAATWFTIYLFINYLSSLEYKLHKDMTLLILPQYSTWHITFNNFKVWN